MANLTPEQYGPWALIAGGSEGIGLAFARELAAAGLNLILLARRPGPLASAQDELRAQYAVDVEVHAVDLTAEEFENTLLDITAKREIGLAIYNAGAVHGAACFHDAPLDKARKLIALNCTGTTTFAYHLGAKMRSRGRGGLILMSSVSGLSGGAYIATYAATKAYILHFSEALWAECRTQGVSVMALCPGITHTAFFNVAGVPSRLKKRA